MSKREIKKEAILVAGMEVMKAQGYNGCSVKDIVDAAKVPKGSFYNYFPSKEQFALDAIEFTASEARTHAQALLGDCSECALDRLTRFFHAGIACAESSEFKVGCFLGNMCQEMADSSDSIRQRLDPILNGKTRLIADVIKEGQEGGSVNAAIDAAVAAEFLFNAWEGALMRAKAAKSRKALDAFVAMLKHVL
ncbi:TetR family transcriptional regulator C-terminal domain-containing protein [Agaribacterium sp. ZY112]|uniref:TetR/AcrR family transcriptional regulator n=1 Tax=Agaribacterium sp. ZY112 TaxID=3233574 RepID=UPI003524D721